MTSRNGMRRAATQRHELATVLLGLAMAGAPWAATQSHAAEGSRAVLSPPLSVPRAAYFQAHPEARAQFTASLRPLVPPMPRTVTSNGGTWTKVTKAPGQGLCSPLLLTDGTVIAAACNSPTWYKLTPDLTGSYAAGTWTTIAKLPAGYSPEYHASAVLPDGRVIIEGGEYNGSNTEVWTNLGAIYDPVADNWTAVAPPTGAGWKNIGDAAGVVLPTGAFMLSSCCGNPDADAIFNPATLKWTATGAPSAGFAYQDEQGYELLPSGDVLTIDIWTNYASKGNATNAERYVPAKSAWISAGNTPVSLPDPYACGNFEIGPAVLRGDGKVVAFGGNTGCVAGAKTDPTAIYSASKNTWRAGPNVLSVCGSGTTSCDLADAPAALLPNGNILFAASAGYGQSPTHFFEFTAKDKIDQVSDTLENAGSSGAYYYNFLVLPTGQILSTDFSDVAELYTPVGAAAAGLAPAITSVPSSITRGAAYTISGKQLNGLSQGAYYGDDAQMATNFPIVRISNTASGHIFYGRTSGFTSMGVAKNAPSSAMFAVPAAAETGVSSLVVVANGVASAPVSVTIN